jgi:RNA polymerase sigma-70 factor (ECF subfamily)
MAFGPLMVVMEVRALARPEPGPAAPVDPASAFAAMVTAHWTGVFQLLHRLTGNVHDTEDLTQEAFLRAFDRLDTFAPGSNQRAWLLRIATNVFFDLQRQRRQARLEPLTTDPPGSAPRPGRALEVAEESELLKVALEELSETARLVFHLRAAEGLSFREIAEIVGTSEENARWHMHQARTKLLKRLTGKL